MTGYNLPPLIFYGLPYLGALAVAVVAYVLSDGVRFRIGGGVRSRLENLADNTAERRRPVSKGVAFGSQAHRLRVAFAGYRIDVSGQEDFYLMAARLGLGFALFLILVVIGFPILPALVGFAGGWIFVNGAINRAWNKVCNDIETEIPSFLTRMEAVIQTAPNVPVAIESVTETLTEGGPLRQWLTELVAKMLQRGQDVMDDVVSEASTLSPSLGICAQLLSRMWTTGGEGYSKAFSSAADNLESVLDARVMARSKGDGARGTVNFLAILTLVMIGFLKHNSALADVVNLPIVQIAYAVIVLAIVYGYNMINDLIDTAV